MNRRLVASAVLFIVFLLALLLLHPSTSPLRLADRAAESDAGADSANARSRGADGRERGVPGAAPDGERVARGTVVDAKTNAPIAGASIAVRAGTPRDEGALLAET